eukprot:1066489-Prymnesium_polylepis.1
MGSSAPNRTTVTRGGAICGGRPQADHNETLLIVSVVQCGIREPHPPVPVVQHVGVRGGVVKVDQAGHALEAHTLDQRLEQLAPHNLGAVLDLKQVVQRMGDCEGCVVPKAVIWPVDGIVVTSAPDWGARVIVMILRPQQIALVISFDAARSAIAGVWWQLLSPGEVRLVVGRALRLAVCHYRKQPLQYLEAKRFVSGKHGVIIPKALRGQRIATEPQIARPTKTDFVRRPDEPGAVGALTEKYDDLTPHLEESALLRRVVGRILKKALCCTDTQPFGEGSTSDGIGTSRAISVGRVYERHGRVIPVGAQNVDHGNSAEGIRGN